MLGLTFYRANFAAQLKRPLIAFRVPAGFPSPADDYLEGWIDLNHYLVKRPASTFFIRVDGDSMTGAGIFDGDLLIVDRAAECPSGSIVVARVESEFTLKRLVIKKSGKVFLVPENDKFPSIELTEDSDCEIWGRVVGSVREY